jgi:hypothetical protein
MMKPTAVGGADCSEDIDICLAELERDLNTINNSPLVELSTSLIKPALSKWFEG